MHVFYSQVGLVGPALDELRYTPKWPLGEDWSTQVTACDIAVPKKKR